MSATSTGIQALNFMGFLDRREESLILNGAQEQAVLKRLLHGRDDQLYQKLYGTKYARDVYTAPRGMSGKNRVMPFWN
jgi:hypothetical protein